MSRAATWLLVAAVLAGCASEPALPQGEVVAIENASFAPDAQGQLAPWVAIEHNTGNSYSFVADRQAPHSAPTSLRINRHGGEIFGLMEQRIRVKPEWVGRTARLSGYLKSAGVDGTGGALVIQARSGGDNILAHEHMDDRRIKGTQDWKLHSVQIKIPPATWALQVGVMLEDGGTLWADDLELQLMP